MRKAQWVVALLLATIVAAGCASKTEFEAAQDRVTALEANSKQIAEDLAALRQEMSSLKAALEQRAAAAERKVAESDRKASAAERKVSAADKRFASTEQALTSLGESIKGLTLRNNDLQKAYDRLDKHWKSASQALDTAQKQVATNYTIFLKNLENQRALAETQLRAVEQMLETLSEAAEAQKKAAGQGGK